MEEMTVTSTLDMLTKRVKLVLAANSIDFDSSENLINDICSKIGTRKGRKPYTFKADSTTIVVVPNQIIFATIEGIKR